MRLSGFNAYAALLVIGSSAALVRAGEWPRFRGEDGLGISNDVIPPQWSDKDFAWKIDLPGIGHSSPVAWGDKVFVTSADEATATRHLLCVSATNGAVLWRKTWESKPFRQHGENSYASSTPAADADHVYVALMDPGSLRVVAISHDGKDAWTADLGPYDTQHGGGSSPIVFEDMVVIANDQDGPESFLVALDRAGGKVRWKTPRRSDKFSASTPCVYRPRDGGPAQLVFTSLPHGVTGVDPKTGKVLWEVADAFNAGTRAVSSPVAGSGLVFATSGEGARGGHWLIAVRPGDGKKGAEVAYKITENVPYVPTPLVYNDMLFYWTESGFLSCAKAATGEKIWQERVGGGYFGSPVCSGGNLFALSKRGEVVVVSASDKYNLLAKHALDEKSHATPAIAGGRMYLRTVSRLYCVGGKPAGT